jgi:hypothetical protein
MKLSKFIAGGIAASLSISSVALAADGDNPMLNDKWRVYVGAFDASVDSKIGFSSEDFPNIPPIDVEEVLGVSDSEIVAVGGAAWHFKRRHALELEFFSLKRNAQLSDTFTPPIQVDDLFIEDGQITTSYDTTVTGLSYSYSILRSERSDLQLSAGIHVAELDVAVQLAGMVCLPTTTPSEPPGCPTSTSGDDSKSVTAPLPHFGASYTYAFTPTWAMNLAVKGFAIEIDSIDGTIIKVDADVAWQPWRNIGFGAGVRYFKTEVTSTGSDVDGGIKFDYFGPMVYVQATF